MPLSDWGFEFSDNMPEEIRDAIRRPAARRNTLRMKSIASASRTNSAAAGSRSSSCRRRERDRHSRRNADQRDRQASCRRSATHDPTQAEAQAERSRYRSFAFRSTGGRQRAGRGATVAVDVPKFRYVGKEQFERTGTWRLGAERSGRPDGAHEPRCADPDRGDQTPPAAVP